MLFTARDVSDNNLRVIHNMTGLTRREFLDVSDNNLRVIHNVEPQQVSTAADVSDNNLRVIHNAARANTAAPTMFLIII